MPRRLALPVFLFLLALAPVATAGTLSSWNGGGGNGNWSTAANWGATTVPTGTSALTPSTLVFSGTTQTTTTNDLGTVTVDSLSFTNDGSSGKTATFTLSGSTLAFSSAAVTTSATTAGSISAGGDYLNMAMTVTGSNTISTGAGHSLSITGNISGSGSITYSGANSNVTAVYVMGNNSYTGGTYVTSGQVWTGNQSSSGTAAFDNSPFGGVGAMVTISGSGSVLVRNSSTLANNFTISGTGFDGNGPLRGSFGSSNQTAVVSGTITLAGDAKIRSTSTAGQSGNKLSLTGPIVLGSNQLTLNPVFLSGNTTTIDISGKISGNGSVVVSGSGTGGSSVFITGSNDYTGGTTVTSGTLRVGNADALGTGPLTVNTNGVDLGATTLRVGALYGSSAGVIQTATTSASARLITNFSNSVTGTYAGVIQNGAGTVGYTKQGTGTQYLTGTSTYTGTTVVDGGSLYVNGQLGNTATAVNSAATLSGNGTIVGGVTVNSGGTISAGQNPSAIGTLTVGSLTLNSGATTALTVNGETTGTYDKLVSTGATTFGGTLAIDMNYAGATFDGNLNGSFWNLYTASSFSGDLDAITMTGTYGTVTFSKVPGNSGRWESQYLGNNKEFAFFTSGVNAGKLFAVPEPSTMALAAIGGLSALGMRWRRRRQPVAC